ncbi:Hsp20 family protein [Ferruginivarius sediminum]|jgi:HSP20 family molecular chaperone IbpA|uniref:Heat-shock protein Hsp20 n=1 Tax=Ferruginivarius sediminum TaxID=2661937 RepID=A0A369TAL1_9PROT|nr:Hsp20 family protein [Ferruginivarius sediminum]RDD61534.1 heat-shock protein Hsp20 [Ferruginivarius sediminum]
MSRVSVFNSPLLLGFDHFERALDRISKTASDGYPPYNVEQVSDDGLRITLAVAGFRPEDLEVRIEDTQLMIRGRQAEDDGERIYLHRGIAARQFQRSFVLSEGIEVVGASLDNGLLHIDLQRVRPEPEVRTVEIKTGRQTSEEITARRGGSRGADGKNGGGTAAKHETQGQG